MPKIIYPGHGELVVNGPDHLSSALTAQKGFANLIVNLIRKGSPGKDKSSPHQGGPISTKDVIATFSEHFNIPHTSHEGSVLDGL
ncbi:hypothetical protein HK102_010539, partial [Quaeritorhiza haematococci]